jgi:hypothetical protein
MQGVPATYLGRIVDKEHFRAFIFNANGNKRLVKSWDEYESCMATGVWFPTLDDAIGVKKEEPKQKRKPKAQKPEPLKVEAEEVEEVHDLQDDGLEDDGMVYEVKPEDDFLPNGNK